MQKNGKGKGKGKGPRTTLVVEAVSLFRLLGKVLYILFNKRMFLLPLQKTELIDMQAKASLLALQFSSSMPR